MRFWSSVLLVGLLRFARPAGAARNKNYGRYLKRNGRTNSKRSGRKLQKLDFTEDVEFWTRFLQESIPSIPIKTSRPTPLLTRNPTRQPVSNPTPEPTIEPIRQPSNEPTRLPTRFPTTEPSNDSTRGLTRSPTLQPSNEPISVPTRQPSNSPTSPPTSQLTPQPSNKPTRSPTFVPTDSPTPPLLPPTIEPSNNPTRPPTPGPTQQPTSAPNVSTTSLPSNSPTLKPTNNPTQQPSFVPTRSPTSPPTVSPSSSPTFPCNLTPEQRAEDIRELMATVTNDSLFDDPTTPQAQALNWVTNEDAIEPTLCPDRKMLQRYVLAAFYFATEGDSWDQCSAPEEFGDPDAVAAANANCNRVVTPFQVNNDRVGDTSTDAWLTPVNECEWGGIACWGQDTPNLEFHIDQLDFENDGLAGTLISEIGALDSLRFLILEQGNITGTIPSTYGDLERLLILDMDFNQITGTLPEEIYGLSSLQQLDLNDNRITGTISPSIGDLNLLTFYQIDHNFIEGTIPTEMGELEQLRIAFLSVNDLTGTMPAEVCANRNDTIPPGNLGVLVSDCSGDPPEVVCTCCSSCAPV